MGTFQQKAENREGGGFTRSVTPKNNQAESPGNKKKISLLIIPQEQNCATPQLINIQSELSTVPY